MNKMNTSGVRFEVLTKENYETWKIQIRAILIKNDEWGYVSGAIAKPAIEARVRSSDKDEDKAAVKAELDWIQKDLKAQSDIILAISPSEIRQVKGCDTSRAIWTKLEEIYQSKGPVRKAALLNQLFSMKMADDGDARAYARSFFELIDTLAEMDVDFNKDVLTVMLLRSLPEKYENFKCAISSRDELPTPEALRIKMAEECDARKQTDNRVVQNAMAVGKFGGKNWRKNQNAKAEKDTGNKNKDAKMKCYNCGILGHRARNCTKPKKSSEQSAGGADSNVSLMSLEALYMSESGYSWCLDSGCTSHMCRDVNAFKRIDRSGVGKLNLADSKCAEIAGKGQVTTTMRANGERKTVDFNETLYVPDLRTNLASVSKITDKGHKVIFCKNQADVVNSNGKTILVAERVNDLYLFQNESNVDCKNANENDKNNKTIIKDSLEDWHIRLGHLNVQYLLQAAKMNTIKGLKIKGNEKNLECEVCLSGKMHRPPFPKASERKTEVGELVHSDVCGPMRVSSHGQKKYFCTFIDDRSGWCEVRFLKQKSEVQKEYDKVAAMIHTHQGKNVKFLQSDNGREYVNANLEESLSKRGTLRRLTAPYNPEQNGVAERRNLTLMETARCLLIQSKLPATFWAEALNTANYVRNRCPSRKLQGKTPFELWHGKQPDVTYFRHFGCEVYIMNRSIGKSKLDPPARKGIFVGYCDETKGFRIWIPDERKVEISRDVSFLKKPNESSSRERSETVLDDPFIEIVLDKTSSDASEENSVIEDSDDEEDFRGFSQADQRIIAINQDSDEEEDFRGFLPEEQFPNQARCTTGKIGIEQLTANPEYKSQLARSNQKVDEQVYSAFLVSEISMSTAMASPDSDKWIEAMGSEVSSILQKKTWKLVPRSKAHDVIGSRFVLCVKYGKDGEQERRKARVVAKGYFQEYGKNYVETYAPVARIESIRLAFAIAARERMHIRQYDVTTAYLNGNLEEEVFMELPKEMKRILKHITEGQKYDHQTIKLARAMLQESSQDDKVCRMNKALYGLKQAGRAWHRRLDRELRNLGATPTAGDTCVYLKGKGDDRVIVLIYVDDILIMSQNLMNIEQFGASLRNLFELKELGKLNYCLGIEFKMDEHEFSMNQGIYIKAILQRFGMSDCHPVSTPIALGTKLTKDEPWSNADGPKPPFRELIGCLLYLARATRPDIAHAVSWLSQFNENFGQPHWSAAKRVLRYLKGTADMGIVYKVGKNTFTGYTDADYGGCIIDRRSFTGYAFIMNGGVVTWDSRKQQTTAASTTEAEYMALSEAAKEAVYLQRFMEELGVKDMKKITLYNDNCSAQKLAQNPVFHSRTKHIDVRHHVIREILSTGMLTLEHVASDDMPADVLTKALSKPKHENCVRLLGLSTRRFRRLSRGEVMEV